MQYILEDEIIKGELLETQKDLGKWKVGGWVGITVEFWDMLKVAQCTRQENDLNQIVSQKKVA